MKKTLLLTAVLLTLVFASCGNDKTVETNVTTVDSSTVVVAPASTGASSSVIVNVDTTSTKK